MQDLIPYVEQLGQAARRAAGALVAVDGAEKVKALHRIADGIRAQAQQILLANTKDLKAAETAGLETALIHRLRLDEKKIRAMADSVDQIAQQVDPVGQTIEGYVRPNGLRIEKRRVPLGVVLFFYESRPNVTSDAAALCLKSGNAVILRGGKEAIHSNQAIVNVIRQALADVAHETDGLAPGTETSSIKSRSSALSPEHSVLSSAVQLVESTDRALVPLLLKLDKHIDVVIPRGGESLIRAVVKDSTIPVLKHYTGNCHIYIDSALDGMREQIVPICVNAKTSYPGGAVCNAVEHLLFHESIAPEMLPLVCAELANKGVEIRADDAARKLFPAARSASESDWDTEYLSYILSVKIVPSLDSAIDHINHHGSHHTDAILSSSRRNIDRFASQVDSASVMVNTSTRFADGGEYGLGAEIGISTDKLHARGPMGASDLTTYKWIVSGDGQIRE